MIIKDELYHQIVNERNRYKKALEIIANKKSMGNSFLWSEFQNLCQYALGRTNRFDVLNQVWAPSGNDLDAIDNIGQKPIPSKPTRDNSPLDTYSISEAEEMIDDRRRNHQRQLEWWWKSLTPEQQLENLHDKPAGL